MTFNGLLLPFVEFMYLFSPIIPALWLKNCKYSSFEVKSDLSSTGLSVDRIYSIYIIGNPPNIELLQSVDGNTYACPQ